MKKTRYWLISTSLDTLDDFCIATSDGDVITEEMLNESNPSDTRVKVMELTSRQGERLMTNGHNTVKAVTG